MAYRTFTPYKSRSQRRRQLEARKGYAIIAACALAFAGMLYGAAKIDQAHGIDARSYELTRTTPDGMVYVLDYNLTADDCLQAMRPGLACEVER